MTVQCAASVLAILAWATLQPPVARPTAHRGAHQSTFQPTTPAGIARSIRGFLYATYSGDFKEYRNWILPEEGSSALVGKQTLTAKQLNDLRREVDEIEFRQVSPFVADGREASTADGGFRVGTKTTYMTGFRGSRIVIPVVYSDTGWKVDVRFWLATKKEAEGKLQQSDPEVLAKAFLFYLLARQPQKLAALSASSIKAEEYTQENNLPGGDLDQILSLCMEMPIVRARLGESFRMPSGEIVRAGVQPDTLVLVGLLGTVEVAFQVKQVGGEWKVVPQKYFEMLRRAGAI